MTREEIVQDFLQFLEENNCREKFESKAKSTFEPVVDNYDFKRHLEETSFGPQHFLDICFVWDAQFWVDLDDKWKKRLKANEDNSNSLS